MSERTISVKIDCEEENCGKCDHWINDYDENQNDRHSCEVFGGLFKIDQTLSGQFIRLEECIKAEFAPLPFEKQYAIIIAKYKAEHKHIPTISFSGELPSPPEKIIPEQS